MGHQLWPTYNFGNKPEPHSSIIVRLFNVCTNPCFGLTCLMRLLGVNDLLFLMRDFPGSNTNPETGCNVNSILCKYLPQFISRTLPTKTFPLIYYSSLDAWSLFYLTTFFCHRCYTAARVDGRGYVSTINQPDSCQKNNDTIEIGL